MRLTVIDYAAMTLTFTLFVGLTTVSVYPPLMSALVSMVVP